MGTTITIEDGPRFVAANPDWDRPFRVVGTGEREQDGVVIRVWRCAWATPKSSPNGEKFAFVGFVCASAMGFVEAAPVIGDHGWESAENRAIQNVLRNQCAECGTLTEFRVSRRRLGPECIRVTTTCKACGASDTDILD